MLSVIRVEAGVVGINYMWLPTWVGLNSVLLKDLENYVKQKALNKALTEDTLRELHGHVTEYLCQRFPKIRGLKTCLDAIEVVDYE